MPNNTTIFEPVNDIIIADIIKELRDQGHYLTGALEASLKEREVAEAGGVTLTAEALAYLEDLEKGLAPNQIDDSVAAINEMAKYVSLRMGYTGKKAIQVAVAIIRKQQKEGNPTRNSYKYSKTGSRTEAVEGVFYENRERYTGLVDTAAIGSLDKDFSSIQSGTI